MPCIFSSRVSYPFVPPQWTSSACIIFTVLTGFCPVSGSPLPDDPHTRFYSQLQSVTGQVTSGITHHCHLDPILMGTPGQTLRGCHLDPPKTCSIFAGDALDWILFWHPGPGQFQTVQTVLRSQLPKVIHWNSLLVNFCLSYLCHKHLPFDIVLHWFVLTIYWHLSHPGTMRHHLVILWGVCENTWFTVGSGNPF